MRVDCTREITHRSVVLARIVPFTGVIGATLGDGVTQTLLALMSE